MYDDSTIVYDVHKYVRVYLYGLNKFVGIQFSVRCKCMSVFVFV